MREKKQGQGMQTEKDNKLSSSWEVCSRQISTEVREKIWTGGKDQREQYVIVIGNRWHLPW